jgi:hypothetical protein
LGCTLRVGCPPVAEVAHCLGEFFEQIGHHTDVSTISRELYKFYFDQLRLNVSSILCVLEPDIYLNLL